MTVRIEVSHDVLFVRVSGIDLVLGLARTIIVPRAAITAACVVPIAEAKRDLGWRIGGGYFPGRLATGWFTVRGRRGYRQWWRTYREKEVLLVDTNLKRPARLVIQTEERRELAAMLNPATPRR